MRLVVVGRPEERARVRDELEEHGIEVVAEFDTLAEARSSMIAADGTLVAGSAAGTSGGFEERLTAREIEVLELLVEGLPNKAIADRLGISDQTVKFHVASICGKLSASNRTDAVRKALHRGLITV
jgi:DNA-binding NarL/FixJ family response regulator